MVDFEVDWRLLAARDPGADLLDVVPVGAGPVDLLDYASDSSVEVLDVVVAAERRIAAAQALQMRALARFARLRPSGDPDNAMSEFAADEVAPSLRLSRSSAAVRLDLATSLTTRLPRTLAALERGEIDLSKARAVVEATDPLTDEHAAAVQDRVLGRAGTQTQSAGGQSAACRAAGRSRRRRTAPRAAA